MKKLLILLAIILFPTSGMAESVWIHGGGKSRMLDIQRGPGGQVQIWDLTNGGLVTGERSGDSNYFLDYQTGKGKWINGVPLDDAVNIHFLEDD